MKGTQKEIQETLAAILKTQREQAAILDQIIEKLNTLQTLK